VLGQIILTKHGRRFTSSHVANEWFDKLTYQQVCTAETQAYRNMVMTADHFRGAIGEIVTCKTRDADGHAARLRGVLAAADADSITITTDAGDHTVALDAVDAARTVFEWGPAPKPGKGSRPGRKKEVARS